MRRGSPNQNRHHTGEQHLGACVAHTPADEDEDEADHADENEPEEPAAHSKHAPCGADGRGLEQHQHADAQTQTTTPPVRIPNSVF